MITLFKKKSNINTLVLNQLSCDKNICTIHSYHSVYKENIKKYLRYSLISYQDKAPINDTVYYCFLLGDKHIHLKINAIKDNVLEISYLSEKPLNLWVKDKYEILQPEEDSVWQLI